MVPCGGGAALRQLPPGKAGGVAELIAFGDPLFSAERAAGSGEGETPETLIKVADAGAITTRGMPLKRRSSPQTRRRQQRRTWPCCRGCPTPPTN
jgi:hypothetical protein